VTLNTAIPNKNTWKSIITQHMRSKHVGFFQKKHVVKDSEETPSVSQAFEYFMKYVIGDNTPFNINNSKYVVS
jgi:hypothetical protein